MRLTRTGQDNWQPPVKLTPAQRLQRDGTIILPMQSAPWWLKILENSGSVRKAVK